LKKKALGSHFDRKSTSPRSQSDSPQRRRGVKYEFDPRRVADELTGNDQQLHTASVQSSVTSYFSKTEVLNQISLHKKK
jgi:hypothetical protein